MTVLQVKLYAMVTQDGQLYQWLCCDAHCQLRIISCNRFNFFTKKLWRNPTLLQFTSLHVKAQTDDTACSVMSASRPQFTHSLIRICILKSVKDTRLLPVFIRKCRYASIYCSMRSIITSTMSYSIYASTALPQLD